MVEAAPPRWNNVLRPVLHLTGACYGAGDGLVRFVAGGSGGPVVFTDLSSSCTGVSFRLVGSLAVKVSMTTRRLGCRGDGAAVDKYVDLATLCSGFKRRAQIQGQHGVGCIPARCSCSVFGFRFVAGIFAAQFKALVRWRLSWSVAGGYHHGFPPATSAMAESRDGKRF
ncbi:hypothetical protein SETIT_3G047000v2 [Setaria italica]|uniref:Uncharacterized protein n=1 Tax=Setaria italica TaxID=4555 RepID=A0A368QDG3_SETIT|nr:hypothetical protein SETIT_3G047000v2 [Setaria italica]